MSDRTEKQRTGLTAEMLFRAIGETDDEMVEDSGMYLAAKKHTWVKWCVAAACAVLVALLGFVIAKQIRVGEKNQPEAGKGLYPETASMLPFVRYCGNSYLDAGQYIDNPQIEALVGDCLGAGSAIDDWNFREWSEAHQADSLVSNVRGMVCIVKGYSPEFRLCVVSERKTDEGTKKVIEFMESFAMAEKATTSAGLFEDCLNISERICGVSYQTHEEWNRGSDEKTEIAGCVGKEFAAFYEELCEGSFEFVYETNPTIYETKEQVHLFLLMDDTTTLKLRLIEGGYVGYDAYSWRFVKMPGEAFDRMFELCR